MALNKFGWNVKTKIMHVDDIAVVSLTPYQCRTIFSWLSIKDAEVSVDTADIHVLHIIEPHLPEEYADQIQRIKDRYNRS